MNLRVWLLAAVAAAGLANRAAAQQNASSFFTGVPVAQVRSTPIDTSRALGVRPAQSALTSNRFNFTALFNKLAMPGYPPKRGVSPLPPASSFPSTKYPNYKMVGTPPFQLGYMFGGGQSPIVPVAPFVPGQNSPVGPGS